MGLSKSTRIIILLAIDTAFFLLELIVGYAVHSLALVADAFHMLNDVLSLCVGLWAVKVANSKSHADTYTYGWQRAETLGALLNGVFLVALCVSIFLEAIQRFVEPQEISNPKLVLIVGCLGLASNLLGLLLFHEHGHSHGSGGHGHSHGDGVNAAEEGHAHSHGDERDVQAADESGNVADVLPQNRFAGWPRTKTTTSASSEQTVAGSVSPLTPKTSASSKHTRARKHSRSGSRPLSGPEDIPVNPSYIRRSIIDAGRLDTLDSDDGGDTDASTPGHDHHNHDDTHDHADSEQPLLRNGGVTSYGTNGKRKPADHSNHNHRQPKEKGSGGGHGHGHDLNMRGILLHVIGDALGNIGVIGTALFIWLTDYSWRFYADPLISLIITAIILTSAIPLCKAASRILLQAVPSHISVDDIRKDIESLDGVLACHDLHVWQLSDTKLIASLHIRVAMDFKNEDAGRYMDLAREIRDCFHEYDIHSVTIQPEFCLDEEHNHSHDDDHDGHHSVPGPSRTASKAGSVCEPQACLLDCDRSCGPDKSCCGPAKSDQEEDHHGHNHAH